MRNLPYFFRKAGLPVLIFLMALPIYSQDFIIDFAPPPPGKLVVDDLYEAIFITNNTGMPSAVMLSATIVEEVDGLIFEGNSAVFEVAAGYNVVSVDQLLPIDIHYTSAMYEEIAVATNSLPAGFYTICFTVLEPESGWELAQHCIFHEISHPSSPVLIMPTDEEAIMTANPMFAWLPPSPLPMEQLVLYRIRIVELIEGQSLIDAIENNPEWYYETEIFQTHWVYPVDARQFEPGMSYAWQIQAYLDNGLIYGENDGKSEIFRFRAGPGDTEFSIVNISPLGACEGQVPDVGLTQQVQVFEWESSGQFQQFEVIVYENPCGKYPEPPDTPTPGPGTTPTPGPNPNPNPNTPVTPTPGGQVTPTPNPADSTQTPVPVTDKPPGEWPDDEGGTTEGLPPLPPGWAWGPNGPYWTGEHPPEPPDLPPGWEWGPLRPVWTGKGEPPPNRNIVHVSEAIYPISDLGLDNQFLTMKLDLASMLEPGQAYIYQVYGIYENETGEMQGVLSQTQCLRFSPFLEGGDLPEPEVCPIPCCNIMLEEKKEPAMDGGLIPKEEKMTIARDDFVPLEATGKDYDQLWWHCIPDPWCPESGSSEMRNLTGRVKFEWKVEQGEGDFVDLGCQTKKKEDNGKHVIFMPPYVPIDTFKQTTLILTIKDDNLTQPEDKEVKKKIRIKTSRKKAAPDHYDIEISSDDYKLPQPTQITGLPMGECIRRGPLWTMDKDLKKPSIILPKVADSDKLVYKEWIKLEATNIREKDRVKVWCESTECTDDEKERLYEDEVEWTWTILSGGGKFIKGNKGRFVIYEAPEQQGPVEIQVECTNPDPLQIVDEKSEPGKIKLMIYQPGVRMDTTQLAWLPEADNNIRKRSYLVYKDGDKWKDAFDHQCRIHFFEMLDFSTEKGTCLNYPASDKADECPDLAIDKKDDYEAYDTLRCRKNKADLQTYYKKARTKEPVKEYNILVNSEDYGGFGFLRSLANVDKSTEKPYRSVPWKITEVKHPEGRAKKQEYDDNRVSIPRDVDENRIADAGWKSKGQQMLNSIFLMNLKEKDPVDARVDQDEIPRSTTPGDGISAYEEYRGFYINGDHSRLEQKTMELLVYDKDNLNLGFFSRSRIKAFEILESEMDSNRVINFNHGVQHLPFVQHGLIMVDASGDPNMTDLFGLAQGTGPGPPRTCDTVKINKTMVDGDANVSLDNVIAHELSHAVNVFHHGDGIITGYLFRGDSVRVDGAWETNNVADTMIYSIACRQGLTSGDTDCWMRYDNYIFYCPITPAWLNFSCSGGPGSGSILNVNLSNCNDNVFGRNITNTPAGAGVNAGGQCGQNAGRGKCVDQIRVTDAP